MHCIYGDSAVGRCLALDRFRHGRTWDDPVDYEALLASLTQVGNLEACFLTWIQTVFMEKQSLCPCLDDLAPTTDDGHNLAPYLFILLLYRNNSGANDDDTMRQYMR